MEDQERRAHAMLEELRTSSEQAAFCKEWVAARYLALIPQWSRLGVAFNIAAGVVTAFLSLPHARPIFVCHLIGALAFYLGAKGRWSWARDGRLQIAAMRFLFCSYAWVLWFYLDRQQWHEIVNSTSCLVGLGSVFILLYAKPSTLGIFVTATLYWLVASAVLLLKGTSLRVSINWALVTLFMYSLFALIQYLRYKRALREAAIIYDNRLLVEANAKLQIEQDLRLARELHRTCFPQSIDSCGELKVAWAIDQKSLLGGDWIGIDTRAKDRVVVAIADVTGKGLQAALIVHALQSLWVDTQQAGRLDPGEWLAKVNRVLFAMGRSQQTLTMGVLEATATRVTYWSAGHVPAIVLAWKDGELQKKVVQGRGSILGMWQDVAIEPGELDLSEYDFFRILIASDGVLPRGGRTRTKDILSLADGFVSEGSRMLDRIDCEDDKSLVMISRAQVPSRPVKLSA